MEPTPPAPEPARATPMEPDPIRSRTAVPGRVVRALTRSSRNPRARVAPAQRQQRQSARVGLPALLVLATQRARPAPTARLVTIAMQALVRRRRQMGSPALAAPRATALPESVEMESAASWIAGCAVRAPPRESPATERVRGRSAGPRWFALQATFVSRVTMAQPAYLAPTSVK